MAATSEKQLQITKQESFGEGLYKTKIIEFLGRSIPIILQSDNGPCPLLAICNVLLLRNILNLSLDTTEISLKRLLSLVAERLIDSNSNTENRDDGYVQNQQQNIGDAIDLLPRLATGIDVNVRFRNVYDFEFTPECAIFDLLDIGLVHGWIFDPQDVDTATVIGSNSYNTLMEKLVALETRNPDGVYIRNLEEDCIDFAAATTATLGVPSPSLSRGRSFDCPLISPISCDQGGRKGDIEEVEELIRVLDLSRADLQGKMDVSLSSGTNPINSSTNSDGSFHLKSSRSGGGTNSSQVPTGDEYKRSYELEVFKSEDKSISSSCDYNDGLSSEIISKETEILSNIPARNQLKESITNESGGHLMEDRLTNVQVQDQGLPFLFPDRRDVSAGIPPFHLKPNDDCRDYGSTAFPDASPKPRSSFSNGRMDSTDVPEDMSSSIEDSEPIYEGEDCILDSIPGVYEDREPMYEGEIILTEQTNGGEEQHGNGVRQENNQTEESCGASLSLTAREGELIQNFLKNNASQLTVYGLFCLQEGLKERELCVFFRNNHFSTLFKFNGELYLLATDQGYINQPDLVWEKLNEVNGDTVFMTGNFREFKAENQGNGTWDEQNATTSTADYLASMDKSAPTDSTFNSDLQLAIALQQQEYEHQPKRQRPHNLQQSSGVVGASRLVTGPEVSRGSSRSTSRQETKNKDKCVVM